MLTSGALLQNRFRIVRLIGQGGMATVYLAHDTRLGGKQWAVKEFAPIFSDQTEQAQALSLFKREAQLLLRLEHPNLPRVIDYFTEGVNHYLVMEYVGGEDLRRRLDKCPGFLEEREVVNWAIQVATVLYFLHSQKPNPIIFRDIKPSNIMLTPEGKAKLIDFGIARVFDPAKKGDTIKIGSPGYAAPEQYGGGQSSIRSDIYSFGVTLHQLLTKLDPSATPTLFNLPLPRTINPRVSQRMEAIITRATHPDPNRRYASALEMKRDLQALITPSPTKPTTGQKQLGTIPVVQKGRTAQPLSAQSVPKAQIKGSLPPRRSGVRTLTVFLLLLLAPVASPTPSPKQSPSPTPTAHVKSLRELGLEYYHKKDYQKAIECFQKLIAADPGDGEAHLLASNAAVSGSASLIVLGLVISTEDGKPNVPSQEMLQGAALAVKEINSTGGIGGAKLLVEIRDDRGTPEGANRAALQLSQNKNVLAVVGHPFSSPLLTASPIYNDSHLVLVSPNARKAEVTFAGDYVYRVCPDTVAEEKAILRLLLDQGFVKGNRIGLVYDKGKGCEERAAYIRNHAPGIVTEQVLLKEGDRKALVGEMTRKKVSTVWVCLDEPLLRVFCQACKEAGFQADLVLDDGDPDMEREIRPTPCLDGALQLVSFSLTSDEGEAALFSENFARLFGHARPGAISAQTYDALKFLAQGAGDVLSKIKTDETQPLRESLKSYLDSARYSGVTGKISFDRFGDVEKQWTVLRQEKGRFIRVGILGAQQPEK
ncbi:MAG: ABC transporter substrate-binding protein [Armatimonadetes bacterium]|nr:ABC transporter substrate-binding protein [Armatimonadota bacterium]